MAKEDAPDRPLAKVFTTPAGVTTDTVPLSAIATYKFPFPSKAKPAGTLNPLANSLTTPAGVTSDTVPVPLFPTYRSPLPSKAKP
jgi:hypothetical protein